MMTPYTMLTHLGSLSPIAIAAHLEEQGVRGYRSSFLSCPIAVYLTDLDHSGYWGVGHNNAYRYTPNKTVHTEGIVVPDTVEQFITEFDCGGYPALLTASARFEIAEEAS